jgi:hypothetical protein
MTIYDVVTLFVATTGVVLAIISQLRISKTEQDFNNDFSNTNRRINAVIDHQEEMDRSLKARIETLESPVMPDEAETETTTSKGVNPTILELALFHNAIHCQQSVRDWMHECDWSQYVSNPEIKRELAEVMRLISEVGNEWKGSVIRRGSAIPGWFRDLIYQDPPKLPDEGVRTIMTRLNRIHNASNPGTPDLKPFPQAYKA